MQITFEFVHFKPISIWFITVMVVLSPAMVIRDYEDRKEKRGLWVSLLFMKKGFFLLLISLEHKNIYRELLEITMIIS